MSWLRKKTIRKLRFTARLPCHISEALKPTGSYAVGAGAYPGFCSMKRLVFLLYLDGMLVHGRSLPHGMLGFPNNSPVPISTPGWREALRELSLAQEHRT